MCNADTLRKCEYRINGSKWAEVDQVLKHSKIPSNKLRSRPSTSFTFILHPVTLIQSDFQVPVFNCANTTSKPFGRGRIPASRRRPPSTESITETKQIFRRKQTARGVVGDKLITEEIACVSNINQ